MRLPAGGLISIYPRWLEAIAELFSAVFQNALRYKLAFSPIRCMNIRREDGQELPALRGPWAKWSLLPAAVTLRRTGKEAARLPRRARPHPQVVNMGSACQDLTLAEPGHRTLTCWTN